jgi:hypothetical protein
MYAVFQGDDAKEQAEYFIRRTEEVRENIRLNQELLRRLKNARDSQDDDRVRSR